MRALRLPALLDSLVTHNGAAVVGRRRQANIARDFPSVLELSIEYLGREDAGRLLSNPANVGEQLGRRMVLTALSWMSALARIADHSHNLSVDLFEGPNDHAEQLGLPADLTDELLRKRTAVAGL